VPGGVLAGKEAEGSGITEVAVAVHSVRVTVTVLMVVSRRHKVQLSASCGMRGEVSYHEVPEHGGLHPRE
jgi:hypothetical protein